MKLSFMGTRYIQWRCWMIPDKVNVNEWNPELLVRLECFILCNVNVSEWTIYWYAATTPSPPTTTRSISMIYTDVIVVRCRSSRPVHWFHEKNRLKITDHIEQNSVRVIMVTICTIEYMSETSRIIIDLYLKY